MITPTVGRIVHFFVIRGADAQAAIVTRVWTDRLVDLNVFGDAGCVSIVSVRLHQPEDQHEQDRVWCEWMPYQVKKSTGSESGEAAAGTELI